MSSGKVFFLRAITNEHFAKSRRINKKWKPEPRIDARVGAWHEEV
jgi:hypothetical protein